MPDEFDRIQERIDADRERTVAARTRFEGESAEHCTECGDAIPQERRQALPGVELCVDCADLAERR